MNTSIFRNSIFIFVLLILPEVALAVPCTGGNCTGLPGLIGPQTAHMDDNGVWHDTTWKPSWTNLPDDQKNTDAGDIIGKGWYDPGYDSSLWDGLGDDSFFYYIHVEKFRTYSLLDKIFQDRNESCCTPSEPHERTWEYSTSYTHFEESEIYSEISANLTDPLIGSIGSKTSDRSTFGDEWSTTTKTGEKITTKPGCCAGEAYYRQYLITEIMIDIGFQDDITWGYWEDRYWNDTLLLDQYFVGTPRIDKSGTCVVPEPSSIILFLFGVLALLVHNLLQRPYKDYIPKTIFTRYLHIGIGTPLTRRPSHTTQHTGRGTPMKICVA